MIWCDWHWLFFHIDCHGRKFSIGNDLMTAWGFCVCGAKLGSCMIRLVCWQQIVLCHPGILREKSENTNTIPMFRFRVLKCSDVQKKDSTCCRVHSLQKLTFPTVDRGGIMYTLATSFIYTKRILFETRTREANKVNTQNKQKQNVVTAWVTYSSYISHKNWFYTKKLELSLYFMITPLFLHPDTWHAWHVECWSVLSASEHRPSQPECKSGSEDSTHEPHTGHTGNSRMLL